MNAVKTSQRARLLVLLLGVLGLGVLGQGLVINGWLLGDFRRLEETQLRGSARLIKLWLDDFLQPLESLAGAASSWDVTRAAIEQKPGAWWQSQLQATAQARGIGFDAAALVGADGAVLQSFAVSPGSTQWLTLLPEATAEILRRHAPASRARLATQSGWTATPGGLYATASRRVGGATVRPAWVVVGRKFTDDDLLALADLSGTRLNLLTEGADGADAEPFQPGSSPGELRRGGHDDQPLQLCSVLAPGLNAGRQLLCVQSQDSIYLRGKAGADTLRLASLAASVILIASAWLFLDRALLRRLRRLSGELAAVRTGDTGALSRALLDDGRALDELGAWSDSLGKLLARVQRVEADLRAQQQDFRCLAEATGIAIFVLRDQIVYANPFAESLTGYSYDTLLEHRLPDLLHRNDRERMEARLRQILGGNSQRVEFDEVRGLRKNGTPYWARVQTVAITYRDEPAVLVTLFDTSEQRHLAAVLAREKEALQVILAAIAEGIVSLDAAGNVRYLNTAAERLTGHTASAALGRSFAEIAMFTDPRSGRPLPPSALEMVKTGGAPVAANLLTPFGDTRQVEVHAARVFAGDASARAGVVLVLRDVSEPRRGNQNPETQLAR